MSKPKNKIRIHVPAPAAEDVTGSMLYVDSDKNKILLDCGLYQSQNLKEQYQINARNFPFKVKDLNYIFLLHAHTDHSMLLPRLVKEGFCGRVIVPVGAKRLFSVMGKDSCYILKRDAESLTRRYKRKYEPLYSEEDVYKALELFDEYDFRQKIKLNDFLEFEFYYAGHIINSAQVKLWVREGNQVKTIGYTSDIGNERIPQFYSNKFEPIDKVQVLFGEATYSRQVRNITLKDRENDLLKMRNIIKEVCCNRRGKVLIPSFSLNRSQNIATHLYNIFSDDKDFDIPILIDSPLTISICDEFFKLLEGEDLKVFKETMSWKNIKFVKDYAESKKYQTGKEPCVVIASSGMINAGRSVEWVKTLLPEEKNHILFVGFSVDGSIANKIRNNVKQKTIVIEHDTLLNRCGVTELHSFSSHADKESLLNYYSKINTEKVCLVHSEMKSKLAFSKELQNLIAKNNKTTKVVAMNRSTEILV